MSDDSGHSYRSSLGRTPVGTCVVMRREDEVLLLLRKGAHGAGQWSVPGGWVEPGEDPTDGARREVWEEVGVTLGTDLRWLGYTADSHPEDIYSVTMWFFSESWMGRDGLSGEPRNTNPARIEEISWWRLDALNRASGPGQLFLPLRNAIQKGLLLSL